MNEENQACCAHCKVELKHIDYPGGTRSDYWECSSGCGMKFLPVPFVTNPIVAAVAAAAVQPPPTPVISVSKEARESAGKLLNSKWLYYSDDSKRRILEDRIQLAINQATEKLTKENEQLREQLDRTTWSDAQFKNELLQMQIRGLKEDLEALKRSEQTAYTVQNLALEREEKLEKELVEAKEEIGTMKFIIKSMAYQQAKTPPK